MTAQPAMAWDKVTIEVPDDILKEAIVGEFSDDGLRGAWERSLASGRTELVLYFRASALPPLVRARVTRIFERNGYPTPKVETGQEDKTDWTREWRKGFTSFEVGQRFRVVPSWEEIDREGDRLVLRVDPGLAFGTGTHETTQMMLEAVEAFEDRSSRVLDVGTGSGILSIAARKLGFPTVVACDVDDDAVFVAARNMDRNETQVPLFIGSAGALQPASFDLVLANLSLEAIVSILSEIKRVLGPGGAAVLSGVLVSQVARLSRALALEEFHITDRVVRGEWAALTVVPGDY